MHTSAGSINRLPPEILAMIFRAYIDLKNDSPWRLVCVCVKWARVALQMTALWRYILVAGDSTGFRTRTWSVPGFDAYLMTVGRRQICTTRKELEEVFLRAGTGPLDVELYLENSEPDIRIEDVLSRILGQSRGSSQITRLKLSRVPAYVPTFQPVCLSRLREFKWTTSHASHQKWAPFVVQMLSQCRDLYSLHLADEVVLLLRDLEVWSDVQSLVVQGRKILDPTLEALNTVLPQCSSLEELKVMTSAAWPNEASLSITCPRLRTLVLPCEPKHLERIRAPMLTSLEINVEAKVYRMPAPYSSQETDLRWNGEADDTGLEFPLLERLAVCSEYPGWIFRLKVPNLKSLNFYLQSTAPRLTARVASKSTEFGDIFRADWFPTVHTVKFSAIGYWPLFIAALRSVPNAERITVIPEKDNDSELHLVRIFSKGRRYPDFGSGFPRRLCVRDPDFLCPKASHIQIGQEWHELEANTDLDRSLRELVEVRKEHGVPLRSLRVYLSDDPDVIEFV